MKKIIITKIVDTTNYRIEFIDSKWNYECEWINIDKFHIRKFIKDHKNNWYKLDWIHYSDSKYKVWDKIKILSNNSCIKGYDRYIWTTAKIIRIRETWVTKDEDLKEFWKYDFCIDSDKYNHFKWWIQRFPNFWFWESEIEKIS